VASIPKRRVSIYSKGALVALILDLKIRKKTDNKKSIHDVIFLMWERFGKPFIGYDAADYQAIAGEVIGEDLNQYFDECIWQNVPLLDQLNEWLAWLGLRFEMQSDQSGRMIMFEIENEARKKWLKR
jgi:predicted metalloprotease with PDZ domain